MSNQSSASGKTTPKRPSFSRINQGRDTGLVIWIWIFRILVTAAFMLGFVVVFKIALLLLSMSYGTDYPGTITDTGVGHSNRQSTYYLEYSFVIEGVTQKGFQSVGSDIYFHYTLGPLERTVGQPVVLNRDVVVRHFAIGPFEYSGLPQIVSPVSEAKSLGVFAVIWFMFTGVFMYLIWFKSMARRNEPRAVPLPE